MSRLRIITVASCLLAAHASLILTAQQTMSRKELHKLLAEANSPEASAKLELYYRGEAARYQALGRQEQNEMQRSQNIVPWEKSPRRSESARQLLEYDQRIATRNMELAEKYSRMAHPNR